VADLAGPREDSEAVAAEMPRVRENAFERTGASQPQGGGKPLPFVRSRRACQFRVQCVSRARPFARRAPKTLRPLRVAFRARKPWVRARLRRLGWKVRFMLDGLVWGAAAEEGPSRREIKERKDRDFGPIRQLQK